MVVMWRRTIDGSRATDSTAYNRNWLVSWDGVGQTLLAGGGWTAGWTDDGVGLYLHRGEPLGIYEQSPNGGEMVLVLEFPSPLALCEPLRGMDLKFACMDYERRSDAWLIENFDPHVN